jgi:membrane dipeptidase
LATAIDGPGRDALRFDSVILDRRKFLKATALAGVGVGLARTAAAAAPTPTWPPYRNIVAIDGASGLWLPFQKGKELAAELAALRASGLSALMLHVAPQGRFWLNDAAFAATKNMLDQWRRTAAQHAKHIFIIERGADLVRAHRERRLGLILWFQGTEPLGEDLDRVALFRKRGVRVIQLTHNRRNLVGDGATEPGNAGLSNYGHQVVERLNAEKIVVDLAHGSQRTINAGIAASKAPVLISHTGCRALADLPRNTRDEELRALAERGGVAGIIFWPYLRMDTQPMASDVIRHIEHAIKVAGEDHVGIGTDGGVRAIERTPEFEKENRETIRWMKEDGIFAKERPDDLYTFIPDLNMPNRFEVLGAMLAERGHSEARIAKILGGNFAREMGEVWG